MAIQFARCEYVSRSSGGNACRKASYNQREAFRCERTGELFSFKKHGGNAHHEVLLPEGAHERFKNSGVLWNEVENCERRINSQLAKEFVLALPDDAQVTLEDRIELTRRFAQIFVEKGVAVQLDIHSPHEGEKLVPAKAGNWHAHLLVTTRRFSDDGLTFGAKARNLDPVVRGGKVIEANVWGEVWRDLQNTYFQEKGYDLCVDPIGIVPQEHLGPVRMRHHLNEAVLRAEFLQKANEKIAQDPEAVLEEMTRNRSVFTQKDVEVFLKKHVPEKEREGLLEKVLEHPDVVELYHKETKEKKLGYFTTKAVRAEEEKLLRFADAISEKSASTLSSGAILKGLENKTLTDEQKAAYNLCVSSGQNLNIIQGRAGAGKSYVINAIREAHEVSGFRVLGLAPTNKVAQDLKNDGFQEAKTCHSFLFAHKNNREKLDSNTVVIVDEAGMLGTTLSVELLNVVKNNGAKLILVGDDRQLSSVERGGAFQLLSERYGAATLKDVRRQTIEWQKTVSESLAEGNVKTAVQLLEEYKAISWNNTKEESLAELLNAYAQESQCNPHESRLILTQKNVDVDALNQGVRDILRSQERLGETEIICSTGRGRVSFAEGDRIQLIMTDKAQGLMSASFGTIEYIDLKRKTMTVRLDNNEIKEINPNTYTGLRHGYASTVYQAQGATLDHVYVLHSSTTNQSTNYVALTRQAKSLHLYVSRDETPSQKSLIQQMERAESKRTSLVFDTAQDFKKKQQEPSLSTHLKHGFKSLVTKVKDAFHRNKAFYHFEKFASIHLEKAEIVVNKPQEWRREENVSYLKNNEKVKSEERPFQKEQNRDVLPSKSKGLKLPSSPPVLEANAVEEALKQNMAAFADDIFSSLGKPYNIAASSSSERRYGKKGHIAVNLKTGAWIDYKDDSLSGGPLHMLTKLKGLSFKEALDYGANWSGLSQRELSQRNLVRSADKTATQTNEHAAETNERIEKAQALWNKGRPLQGTLAEQYLRVHRKIESDLPNDLRYLPFFTDTASKQSFPCLMVGARSQSGELTAVQLTFLHPTTAAKADIDISKKSFGVIKGLAVTLQENSLDKITRNENKTPNILFIAEGVETALSLKSAGIQGTIKASLGLSNIKRLIPEKADTPIVICADHDAPLSPATKSLEKSVTALKESGYSVRVIKPNQLGDDFNDVLKKQGPQGVRAAIERGFRRESFLGKKQIDKVFAKDLPRKSAPSKDHAEPFSPIEKAANHSSQAFQRASHLTAQKPDIGARPKEIIQVSSASLREQKPHLKELKEMELDEMEIGR